VKVVAGEVEETEMGMMPPQEEAGDVLVEEMIGLHPLIIGPHPLIIGLHPLIIGLHPLIIGLHPLRVDTKKKKVFQMKMVS